MVATPLHPVCYRCFIVSVATPVLLADNQCRIVGCSTVIDDTSASWLRLLNQCACWRCGCGVVKDDLSRILRSVAVAIASPVLVPDTVYHRCRCYTITAGRRRYHRVTAIHAIHAIAETAVLIGSVTAQLSTYTIAHSWLLPPYHECWLTPPCHMGPCNVVIIPLSAGNITTRHTVSYCSNPEHGDAICAPASTGDVSAGYCNAMVAR